jgi:hypothetical protein
MTEFKTGDRVEKVAPHNAIRDGENNPNGPDTFAREAAMGALGTVIRSAATHLYVKWDNGKTSCVPREVVAPTRPDPSKVKPGDTVTLESDGGRKVTAPVSEHTLPGKAQGTWFLDVHPDDGPVSFSAAHWTLTDHQPAPEPEPEWKPGTVADITVHPSGVLRAVRARVGDYWAADTEEVYSDDEVESVRPLVVIDPADVDVVALQREIDDAMPGHEASVALERLGLNR